MERSRGVVSGILLVYLALALLVLPLQWIGAVIFAAAVHEGCHYLAIRCCGGLVRRFRIGLGGAQMEVDCLSHWQELFCSLAGPIGGLALLIIARWLPRTALCAAFHSLFNLLPVYPLDGGRALRCVTAMLLPPKIGEWVCRWLERLCLGGILILGFYGSFILKLGLMPIILAILLLHRVFHGKIPCKPSRVWVQ